MSDPQPGKIEKPATEPSRSGFFSELWSFLGHNKKWWLLPIVLMLLLFGVLVLLSGSGLAPFIYTFF